MKLKQAKKILDKRIRVLEARLIQIDENYACYREIKEEMEAMKIIREVLEDDTNAERAVLQNGNNQMECS